jgi:hypothetical protein
MRLTLLRVGLLLLVFPLAACGTGTVKSGPCFNVLYPLAAGRQWKYNLDQQNAKQTALLSVTGVTGDSASLDFIDESGGSPSSFIIHCTDGALTSFSGAEIGFLFFSSGASLTAKTTSGLVAPSRKQFEEMDWQYFWETGLTVSGLITVDAPFLGEIDLIFDDAPVQIRWMTAGGGEGAFESVTTPAGTFSRAVKVTGTAVFNLELDANLGFLRRKIPAVLELTSALWYQPDIGLVRQVFTSSTVSAGGFTYPIEIPSQMILLEYNFSP